MIAATSKVLGASDKIYDRCRRDYGVGGKLGNAIRYTPQEGKITNQIYSENDQDVLRVRDTGFWIPPADRPHIF